MQVGAAPHANSAGQGRERVNPNPLGEAVFHSSTSFGELVRLYRLRRRQIHNNQPWTQEDLAVAIGSDKSHISRIERGHQQPSPQTLVRIADALELCWAERSHLIGLAGHVLTPPSPTAEEVEGAIQAAAPFLHNAPYPAALLDIESRLWDVNDLHARTWYWHSGRADCLGDLKGALAIEEMIDPRTAEWFRRVFVDFDAFRRRQIVRFWYVFRDRQTNPELQAILKRLLAVNELKAIWLEISANPAQQTGCTFINHQSLTLQHPRFGRHSRQVWHSVVAFDDRFLVVHHLPADQAARKLFALLSGSEDGPLPSHRSGRRRESDRRMGSFVDQLTRQSMHYPWAG